MNILKLAVAAAITLSSLVLPAAAASAQRGDRWEQNDGRSDGYRNDRRRWRGDRNRGWRGDRRWRGNRNWRGNRYRSCRTVWRYGHRQRICYWRYRR
ncbi:MAG TPA: hypothetical protein VGO55_08755 [Allosphingosinicella sp.]|jgi:hypothetical protein|nr:hypothetical protein [Allosphingosinicella sp.]